MLLVLRVSKPAAQCEQVVAPGVDEKRLRGHASQPLRVPREPGGHGKQGPPASLQWPLGQFGHTTHTTSSMVRIRTPVALLVLRPAGQLEQGEVE